MEGIKLRNFWSLRWLSYVPILAVYTVSQKCYPGHARILLGYVLNWLLVYCKLMNNNKIKK